MNALYQTALWDLLEYKPLWTLTLKGWFMVLSLAAPAIAVFIMGIQRFLCLAKPIAAEVLVVEGWLRDEAIAGALQEFHRGSYQLLITTGVPLNRGIYLSEYQTFAELAAATLIRLGFAPDKLVAVSAPKVLRDRTLTTAIAVRDWLGQANLEIRGINVYSFDVHTRRTWLLYRRVLEPRLRVGAIAYHSPDYPPHRWWAQSGSVRDVMSETIAYLYVKFINWRA
ncbi:MAG: YdcF family protein [Chloroflexaceae bacterium]|nr:YdcF family protein [Chloroflexaceae bacterium]